MTRRRSPEDLKHALWWSPADAALMTGIGHDVWVQAYARGEQILARGERPNERPFVRGFRTGTQGRVHIDVDSAQAWLADNGVERLRAGVPDCRAINDAFFAAVARGEI